MKTILFTGSSGYFGSTVIDTVVNKTRIMNNYEVNVASYRASDRPTKRWMGKVAKTFDIDPTEPVDSITRNAFEKNNYVVLVPYSKKDSVESIESMVKLCKANNVEHIILFSLIVPARDSILGKEYKKIEDAVEYSGINFTIVRLGILAHRFHWFKEDINNKVLPLPIGKGKFAPLNEIDAGELMALLLEDLPSHKGKYYNLTGPELFDGREIAKIISKELDIDVKYVSIQESAAESLLWDSGVKKAKAFAEFFVGVSKGVYEMVSPLNAIFPNAPKPRTLRDYFNDNIDYFGGREKMEEKKLEKLLEELNETMKDNFQNLNVILKRIVEKQEELFCKHSQPFSVAGKKEVERSRYYE